MRYGFLISVLLFSIFSTSCGPRSASTSSTTASLSDARDLPWVARHGLNTDQYQAEFERLAGLGYRPSYVSGYELNNEARYAAVFEQDPGSVPWIARHGMTSEQYQKEFTSIVNQGYRPTLVNGYSVGNQDYYTAIWELRDGPAWFARHGMSSEDYQNEFDKQLAAGFRPIHVSGYNAYGVERYAAIWEQSIGPAWTARHGMSADEYQMEFDRLGQAGFRLVHVSAFTVNDQDRFAAIWELRNGLPFIARHGLNAETYQQSFDDYRYQGYRPAVISGYGSRGTDRYAAIWHNTAYSATELNRIDAIVENVRSSSGIPGISIAIAKDGRLVFAKGYGFADRENQIALRPSHLFRIASLSKPITATAILKLSEQGRLNLDQTVFGPNGILGDSYGSLRPYNPGVADITIRQLLNHTSGGWTNDASDPMFLNPEMDQTQLISWVLDNRPLNNTPGTVYAYSNFGYSLLGRIIERVSGQSYQDWVKQNVLFASPQMAIAGDSRAARRPNEVVYYDVNTEAPYSMKVARMDAHGGWLGSPIDLLRFGVSVDSFAGKPDQLSFLSLTDMVQGSLANPNYALGWVVNSLGNYWHDGSLPGTSSILVRTSGGFVWSALTNSRENNPNIDAMMWDVNGAVDGWPTFDLF